MRLAFLGSPAFAVPALHALVEAGHEIAAVYCQPPRRANRGQALTRCAIHQAADAIGLPVRTPARIRRDAAEHAAFAALGLDAAVVAAYGLILPAEMLTAPRLGCLNIHASLLPRWRGAAPIHAAVLAGDAETGITIMQMDEGLDTGAMLLRAAIPIGPRATTPELLDQLAALGARLVVQALATQASAVPLAAIPQPEAGVTYAAKLTRADGQLDFTQPAIALDRRVRAMSPWPGTYALLGTDMLKILEAEPVSPPGVAPPAVSHLTDLQPANLQPGVIQSGVARPTVPQPGHPPPVHSEPACAQSDPAGPDPAQLPAQPKPDNPTGQPPSPGRILAPDFTVACGTGALRLVRVQRAGRPAADGAAFLRGLQGWQNLVLA